jgi:nitrate/nitrite transporter NarK
MRPRTIRIILILVAVIAIGIAAGSIWGVVPNPFPKTEETVTTALDKANPTDEEKTKAKDAVSSANKIAQRNRMTGIATLCGNFLIGGVIIGVAGVGFQNRDEIQKRISNQYEKAKQSAQSMGQSLMSARHRRQS